MATQQKAGAEKPAKSSSKSVSTKKSKASGSSVPSFTTEQELWAYREMLHIRRFEEKAAKYPECKMFAERLPAFGFYFWHVDGVVLDNVKIEATCPEERPAIVLEDALNMTVDGKALDLDDLPPGVQLIP